MGTTLSNNREEKIQNTQTSIFLQRKAYNKKKKQTEKLLILSFSNIDFYIHFNKKNKYIVTNDNMNVTDETIYDELISNQLAIIKKNVINTFDYYLSSKEIFYKFSILNRLYNKCNVESLLDDYKITQIISSLSFLLNLNLLSYSSILLLTIRYYVTQEKLLIAIDYEKSCVYVHLAEAIINIQEKIIFYKNSKDKELISNLERIYKEINEIIILILNSSNYYELEFLISTFYNKFTDVDTNTDAKDTFISYIVEDKYFYLVVNLIKIIIIILINNKNISIEKKVEVLRKLITDKNRIIRIVNSDTFIQYSLLQISSEMFTFFDLYIYSNLLTKTYIDNVDKNNFTNIFKAIKNLNLYENYENNEYMDLDSLINKLGAHINLFYFSFVVDIGSIKLEELKKEIKIDKKASNNTSFIKYIKKKLYVSKESPKKCK